MPVDVILSWPRACDYPLWRKFLAENRHRFARVLIVFTHQEGEDYSRFVAETLGDLAECYDSPPPQLDWRYTAVNFALDKSDAEYVWFTEQDFFVTDPSFWDELTGDAAGWLESDRWHPSSLWVKRALIEQTTRYFGTPPVDHFWQFGGELEALTPIHEIKSGFRHMQGVSHNHYLIHAGIEDGIFRRDQFREYLRASLRAGVPLHPIWEAEARRELE